MDKSNVISMPIKGKVKSKTRKRKVRNVDGIKYFTEKQIKMLRRMVRDQAVLDKKKKMVTRYMLGYTIAGRYLFVVYALKGKGVARIITAMDMDNKTRKLYLRRCRRSKR